MPKLVRLYIVNVALGFVLSLIFVALMVGFDVRNLRHLIFETEMGWLAAIMLVMFNGIVFAGVQFAIAIMRMAEGDTPPGGGKRDAIPLDPVAIPAMAPATARKRR